MPSRLPNPGADAGAWGTVLNDFLAPSAATVTQGSQWFDTTQKPFWSDGTNWRDATGTVV